MAATVERMLPLYEGKMGHQYDDRFASFTGVGDNDIVLNTGHGYEDVVQPRYWVREEVTKDRLGRRDWGTTDTLLGFRRVARNTDERTCIASFVPFGPASYGWILSAGPDAKGLAVLIAQYNSFVFDYLMRQFLSQPSVPQGTFAQLPTLTPAMAHGQCPWRDESLENWLSTRVAALTCTSETFDNVVGQLVGQPGYYVWDERAREMIRAEIDAGMFHLFGVLRDEAIHILDSFPIVKRKDKAAYGEYRTKRIILDIFDAMQQAIDSGVPYEPIVVMSPIEVATG